MMSSNRGKLHLLVLIARRGSRTRRDVEDERRKEEQDRDRERERKKLDELVLDVER